MIKVALATLYFFVSILFFPYAYNAIFLVLASKLYRLPKSNSIQNSPKVTIQLPVYNERYVVKRLLEAVFSLDWPRDRLQVLVLDDSTDDTSSIIDSEIEKHRSKGIDFKVIRRNERKDFKAGALQNALNYTDGKYVAIFDADFIPPENFLKETIPWLEKDPKLAIVQTRWGHVNRDYNNFTEAFALGMDGHYLIEQTGRYSLGLLFNFNGTCGVIRVEAIRDAGGWSAETLTEDLDLSYRIQFKGWKALYLKDLVVPGEAPPNIPAFRNQQARWAQGSIQCSRKYLGYIWMSTKFSLLQKIQATIHLTAYVVQPLILIMLLLTVPMMIFRGYDLMPSSTIFFLLHIFSMMSSMSLYYFTLRINGSGIIKNIKNFFFMTFLGFGLSPQIAISVVKGLSSYGGFFERTPKYDIKLKEDNWKDKVYKPLQSLPIIEILLVIYSLIGLIFALVNNQWALIFYLSFYLTGFSMVAYFTHNHYKQYIH